ncbi:MAG: FtsQ-type POTRA domain-containing protein [Acidobacteria bacterium]|nr:MAG: FtsQ-type POTRA domain-containing protein [Acidobacteriota bacterium]
MSLPPIERPKVLPFRPRQGQRVPYRRRSPLRRLLVPFAAALATVVLPLAAVQWLLSTPRLALVEIEAVPDAAAPGGPRVSREQVLDALAPLVGRNLLRLDLGRVQEELAGHPWVRAVAVRKELPHRLRVEIEERRAAALYQAAEGLIYVDGEGRPIAPLAPWDEVDLVVISGGGTPAAGLRTPLAAALAVAGELAAVKPAWAEGLSEIEVLSPQDFRLVIDRVPFPLLVRAGALERRVRRLETLLPQITTRYAAVKAVDLRFSRRIIIEPADHPQGGPPTTSQHGV